MMEVPGDRLRPPHNTHTSYSEYKYNRLKLSRSSRDSLKFFEISVPRHIRFVDLRNKINQTTKFHKWINNLTPEVWVTLKILWKRRDIAPEEQFLLFSTIFCYRLLHFHVKTGTRFSLRDKRLFEISEVEITRVDCSSSWKHAYIILTPSNPIFIW